MRPTESSQPGIQTLMTGVAFGESPRWHDGRLWFADWAAQEIIAIDPAGNSEVVLRVGFPSFPMCFDWLPDGRMLIVSAREGLLLRPFELMDLALLEAGLLFQTGSLFGQSLLNNVLDG